MDDIKAQWQKMREKPLPERVRYFLSYYKWYVVALISIIVVLVALLVGNLSKKEAVISGVMLNSTNASAGDVFDIFSDRLLDEMGLSSEEFEVSITSNLTYRPNNEENAESNYATVQTLLAQTSGALLDFVIGNLSSVETLAYSRFFADLSELLSEEQMQQLAPYLRYIDLAVIEEIEKAVEAGNYEVDIEIPDSKKPEEMQKPMAVFLDVSNAEWLSGIFPYATEPVVFAMAANAPHKQALLTLIDCLLPQQG